MYLWDSQSRSVVWMRELNVSTAVCVYQLPQLVSEGSFLLRLFLSQEMCGLDLGFRQGAVRL